MFRSELCSLSKSTIFRIFSNTYPTLHTLAGRSTTSGGADGLALQDLMEKVVILRKAVERERKLHTTPTGHALNARMMEYSSLLASQGSLKTALQYLQETGGSQVSSL